MVQNRNGVQFGNEYAPGDVMACTACTSQAHSSQPSSFSGPRLLGSSINTATQVYIYQSCSTQFVEYFVITVTLHISKMNEHTLGAKKAHPNAERNWDKSIDQLPDDHPVHKVPLEKREKWEKKGINPILRAEMDDARKQGNKFDRFLSRLNLMGGQMT